MSPAASPPATPITTTPAAVLEASPPAAPPTPTLTLIAANSAAARLPDWLLHRLKRYEKRQLNKPFLQCMPMIKPLSCGCTGGSTQLGLNGIRVESAPLPSSMPLFLHSLHILFQEHILSILHLCGALLFWVDWQILLKLRIDEQISRLHTGREMHNDNILEIINGQALALLQALTIRECKLVRLVVIPDT